MLKRYNEFLLESLLLESIVAYSNDFKKILRKIDSPVAKALLDIESKDYEVTNNYIDISDNKELVSFTPDKKVQSLKYYFKPTRGESGYSINGVLKNIGNSDEFKIMKHNISFPDPDNIRIPYVPDDGQEVEVVIGGIPMSGWTCNLYKIKFKNPYGDEPSEVMSVVEEYGLEREDPFKLSRQQIRVGRGVQGLLASAKYQFSQSEIEQFVNLNFLILFCVLIPPHNIPSKNLLIFVAVF